MSELDNHPNQKGSKILAIVCLLFVVGIHLLTAFVHPQNFSNLVFLLVDIILAVAVLVMITVNYKNTFETNEAWKTWVLAFAVLAVIAWNAGWIAATFEQ